VFLESHKGLKQPLNGRCCREIVYYLVQLSGSTTCGDLCRVLLRDGRRNLTVTLIGACKTSHFHLMKHVPMRDFEKKKVIKADLMGVCSMIITRDRINPLYHQFPYLFPYIQYAKKQLGYPKNLDQLPTKP
jgi:hypothetical protein